MRSDNKYTQLIEQYLDGEMSSQELLAFQKELGNNVALKQELEFYQLANTVIIQNKISSIKDTINAIKEDYKIKRKNRQICKVIIITTALILALGGIYYWLSKPAPKKTEKVIKQINVLPTDSTTASQNGIDGKRKIQIEESNDEVEIKKENTRIPAKKISRINHSKDTLVLSYIDRSTDSDINQNQQPSDTVAFYKNHKVSTSPENTSVKTTVCDKVIISANPRINASCIGKHEGKIAVSAISGGSAPYTYTLSTGENNTNGVFYNLNPGTYQVEIMDKNHCMGKLENIVIKEERCKLDLYFEPASGNPVSFPIYEKAGVLSIFDKSGNTIFSTRIEFKQRFEWQGNTNSGILNPGYYPFIIKFEDGSMQSGSITVTP